MDEIEATLRAANDCFMAGMAANESATTRKLAQVLAHVDEAHYQLSRVMGDHPTLLHVFRTLQRAKEAAK